MYTVVPRDIIESRDWGRIPDYVAEKAVVIITGTWEGAELFDRPLAYMVANALVSRGFWPVILSDEFILNIGRRLERLIASRTPFITIGGRNSNAFSALVAQETRVNPYEDVGIVEWRGTVVGLAYGRDPFGTRNAVRMFLDRYLDEYVAMIKDRRGISIVQWPTYKQEAGSTTSLTSLLKELTIGKASGVHRLVEATMKQGSESVSEEYRDLVEIVEKRIEVRYHGTGDALKPRILRFYSSSWAPRRVLAEYVSTKDLNDPELFVEVRDLGDGFIEVEVARFGSNPFTVTIDGYEYTIPAYGAREVPLGMGYPTPFNSLGYGYLIHFINAPYARGIISGSNIEEVVGKALEALLKNREVQVVVELDRGVDIAANIILEKLREKGVKARAKVYTKARRAVITITLP